mmetsp:Transcript_54105/g.153284  ORF Transcript_54105/g.153284 Transcript_54105/m.153284 type:complete len:209 (-) Transcript_54105:833-1459(-)
MPRRLHCSVNIVSEGRAHLDAQGARLRTQAVERGHDLARQVAASASRVVVALGPVALSLALAVRVVGRGIGSSADDRNVLDRLRAERQGLVVVLEQNNGLGRCTAGELSVIRGADVLEEVLLAIGRRALRRFCQVVPVNHGEDALRGQVHGRRRRILQLVGIEVLAVAIGALAGAGARHLLVQTVLDAIGMRGPPIRLHEALEAHAIV